MTIYADKKIDPRFHVPPAHAAKAPKVEHLRCGRAACVSTLDVAGITADKRAAFALAHGYVVHDGLTFCSKRCQIIFQMAPDGAQKVDAQAQPKAATKTAAPAPTSVRVRRAKNEAGEPIAWICCEHDGCPSKFEAPVGASDDFIARAASASGYLTSKFGVFCGGTCAKQAAADQEAGIASVVRV